MILGRIRNIGQASLSFMAAVGKISLFTLLEEPVFSLMFLFTEKLTTSLEFFKFLIVLSIFF